MKKTVITLCVGLIALFVSSCSFPRSSVSTEEQDITVAMYDSLVDFTPSTFDTIHLNYYIHIIDTTENEETDIEDTMAIFDGLKTRFEALGYVVDSVQIPTDSFETADLSNMLILNVSEIQAEFTYYYYYYWWGWYYPGYWYSYTYTIGNVVCGMVDVDENNEKREIWTGSISGFTDKYTNQSERIENGLNELFLLPPLSWY